MGKVALVTGGNQGLGFALVSGLCAQLGEDDVVYLTGRNEELCQKAVSAIGETRPMLRWERLDVTDDANVADVATRLDARHGGVDVVISNAAARIARDVPAAEQVSRFVDTNNRGTNRMLRHFLPILRPNARYVVVASSFGRLRHLTDHLHDRFDETRLGLDDIDALLDSYATAVRMDVAALEGWPDWINVPSKIGQVASARVAARKLAVERPGDGILLNAVCPGLVDTAASRPWFEDMSRAKSPAAAAVDVLWLALLPAGTRSPHGELVQFRKVLPRV